MRKLVVLLALTAMVALAGACGPSEDEGSSGKQAPEKARKPTAVETVQVAYRETAAEQTAKTTFEVTTGPAADTKNNGQAPMTFTMRGQGVMDFSGAASSMTMNIFGMGRFEMRQVGEMVYMRTPEGFAAQMPGTRPWIEVDMETIRGRQSGADLGQMEMGIAQDPTGELEYLRGVSDSVERVGIEKVRGTRTTHYRAEIDLKKAAAKEGADARETYDEMIEKLGASRIPVQVWLDEQSRIRRYVLDMTAPMPENTASPNASREDAKMRMHMVAEYYDFGTPVNVQAPPPDQTMDGSKLLSGQQTVSQ